MAPNLKARVRIVTSTPLVHLWNERGALPHQRSRWLGEREIVEFLASGPVQFVVANVGEAPYWVPIGQGSAFWKVEVIPHLVPDPRIGFHLEDFPGEYAYVASEWRHPALESDVPPVVLLETHH